MYTEKDSGSGKEVHHRHATTMLNYFIVMLSETVTENTSCSYLVFTIVTSYGTKVLIIKYNNVVKWHKAALYISHLGQSK